MTGNMTGFGIKCSCCVSGAGGFSVLWGRGSPPSRRPPAAVARAGRAGGSGVGFSPPAPPPPWGGPGLPAEGWRQGRDRASLPAEGSCPGPTRRGACWVPVRVGGCRAHPCDGDSVTLPDPQAGRAGGESALGSSPPRLALPAPAGVRGQAGHGAPRGLLAPWAGGREEKTEKKQQPPAFPFL